MSTIVKSWKTQSGVTVTVTGKLITEKTSYSDGWNIKTDCCEIEVVVDVEGKGRQFGGVVELSPQQLKQVPAGYTHRVGNLGLTTEQADMIKSVRTELESRPEWQAKIETIRKNQEDIAKLEQHGVGWCDKCHSYCFGDCEA